MNNLLFRPLTCEDTPILWQMLMHAAHEPTMERVMSQPCLTQYVENWGRVGDLGFVTIDPSNHQGLGAAWVRLWTGNDRGFGFIDATTPELAIAVVPEWQGQGIGTRLLTLVLDRVRSNYPAISLSVRADNPAVHLYERVGFTRSEGSEVINRTGELSFNMAQHFPS